MRKPFGIPKWMVDVIDHYFHLTLSLISFRLLPEVASLILLIMIAQFRITHYTKNAHQFIRKVYYYWFFLSSTHFSRQTFRISVPNFCHLHRRGKNRTGKVLTYLLTLGKLQGVWAIGKYNCSSVTFPSLHCSC